MRFISLFGTRRYVQLTLLPVEEFEQLQVEEEGVLVLLDSHPHNLLELGHGLLGFEQI